MRSSLAAYSKSSQNCWIVIDEPVAPATTSNAPWGTTPSANNLAGTGQNIVVPNTLGTTYAEVKGDKTAADCLAAILSMAPVPPTSSRPRNIRADSHAEGAARRQIDPIIG